jgi:glycosyltransferase involved in cell wall biosynthesis
MISVVTITFNNFSELTATVDSLRGCPVEHVIINGGGCDKTRSFLDSFQGISLSEPDHGISDAFNKGIHKCTGKGIMFLNSGDRLNDPAYLEWADQALNEVDFVYSDIEFEDEIAGKITIRPSGKPLGRGMPFPHQTMIVRRDLFAELGGFKLDYKRAMCFEFACRLIRAGKRSRYYNGSTVLQDGTGVSVRQEAQTLLESKDAMISHGLYGLQNRYYFFVRNFFFQVRRGMMRLGLKPVLAELKRLKRSL